MLPVCRHRVSGPCAECNSQDTYWSGGKDSTVKRTGHVELGGNVYTFREGDPDKRRTGLTLRPAAVLLAEYLTRFQFDGMHVLELGAGLGLPGMVAYRKGAYVTWTENDKAVAVRLQEAILENACNGQIWSDDWKHIPRLYDAIVGSEILYDVPLIRAALDLVHDRWTGRGPVLFTDANRCRSLIAREAPLKGVRLERVPISGQHPDGRQFVADLWKCEPTMAAQRPPATGK